MECYILSTELKVVPGSRPDATAIKQFINFIQRIITRRKDLLYSISMFNLNKEFECALASLKAGFDLVFFMEETLLREGRPFTLQYVITYGNIEVPRRKGMFRGIVGGGLLRADIRMQNLRDSRDNRFNIEIRDIVESRYLSNLFSLYQMVFDSWGSKDYRLASDLVDIWDYKMVARDMKKSPSLVWKRRKSLNIQQFNMIKDLIRQTPDLVIKKRPAKFNEQPPAF
ncbi:MAG: hypothetical protein NTW31_05705 [Bacteroidetes bacterium]|nr:hypothetical protein [Bacteroidota bacterium]